jgi:predicted transglutaminase-like cysteine proteinase
MNLKSLSLLLPPCFSQQHPLNPLTREGFFCWLGCFLWLFWVLCFSALSYAQQEVLITPQLIEHVKRKYQEPTLSRILSWQTLIQQERQQPIFNKLTLVNDFFNQFEYRSDADQIGRTDYWMTPVEFIDKGGGDCEDYTIAKYFTLQAMGVARQKMRITYVKALRLGVAHMVLSYYQTPQSIPLVLDNLVAEIKSATQRQDLKPVYSFNGDGLWLARQRGQGRRVSGADRLSLWQDLNTRMLAQSQ